MLLASYSGKYGYRRSGPHRAGFEAWAKGLVPPRTLEMFPLGDVERQAAPVAGCAVLTLRNTPGHVPVGHDYLLYRLAELTPLLSGAFFAEESQLGKGEASETPEHGSPAYRLKVWSNGQAFEAGANFYGERYDVDSVVGILNSTLRGLEHTIRFALFSEDRVACGTPAHFALDVMDTGDL